MIAGAGSIPGIPIEKTAAELTISFPGLPGINVPTKTAASAISPPAAQRQNHLRAIRLLL
jgi:hypothetical protein